MDQGGWGAPAQPVPTAQSNAWGTVSDPWASTGNTSQGGFGAGSPPIVAKKDDRDPFANIWQ